MYTFIQHESQNYHLSRLCAALGVSRAAYYAWLSGQSSPRQQANQALVAQIEAIFEQSRRSYGSPRIQAELRAKGIVCNHKRLERLMREHGIRVRLRRRPKAQSTASSKIPRSSNLLQRDFAVSVPNRKWSSDIPYIPTREGWLYLAVVLDIGSRRIVGWAMSKSINQDLVCSALDMALQHRQPPNKTLLHHSDQGSQYCAQSFLQVLQDHEIVISLSRRGNCWDNAVVESFFATLKTELIQNRLFLTRHEAQTAIFDYIEVFYNRQRRHSSLNYRSPLDYEAACTD